MVQRLYDLVPDIYRTRDRAEGQPLRALFLALQSTYDGLAANIEALHRNAFIETCDDWAVPYIGALVDVLDITTESANVATQRKRVADALTYIAYTGLAETIGEAASAASGWPGWTIDRGASAAQSANLRLGVDRAASVNIRSGQGTPPPGRPQPPRSIRVRDANKTLTQAQYRLRAYAIRGVTGAEDKTRTSGTESSWAGYVHPFGVDTPLFNCPTGKEAFITPTEPANLPYPITRSILRLACEAARIDPRADQVLDLLFGQIPFAAHLTFEPADKPKTVEHVTLRDCYAMDLSNWSTSLSPTWLKDRVKDAGRSQILIDPELGRALVFAARDDLSDVRFDYAYGFSTEIGGGPYPRDVPPVDGVGAFFVTQDPPETSDVYFASLEDAVTAWEASTWQTAIIWIASNATVTLKNDLSVDLNGRCLQIMAWDQNRPCISGYLEVTNSGDATSFRVGGCWIEGGLRFSGPLDVAISDCTLAGRHNVPPLALAVGKYTADWSATGLAFEITRSIITRIHLPWMISDLRLFQSLVAEITAGDAAPSAAIGPPLSLVETTVLGRVNCRTLNTMDRSIIAKEATVGNGVSSAIRRSFFQGKIVGDPLYPEARASVSFNSTRLGAPDLGQLSTSSSPAVRGALHDTELGAFSSLAQPRRRMNLRNATRDLIPPGDHLAVEDLT